MRARRALSMTGWSLTLFAALLSAGCMRERTKRAVANLGGNWRRGRQVIEQYHCGACHEIPGVPHAWGLVGSPLEKFGRRTMIAGVLPNTPANLERWLRSPKAVDPLTAMPDLGLNRQQRHDVTAYLYTLR